MVNVKTDEIIKTIVPSLNKSNTNKIFFKKSLTSFNKLKKILAKELNLEGDYNFSSIGFPINELISILYNKEEWGKNEVKLLDTQFSDYVVKYLLKRVAELF
jgi:hypothetical protein